MKTNKPKKSLFLNMALSVHQRSVLERAAAIMELPPSVWGRSVLLREAAKVVRESLVIGAKK